MLRNIIVLPDGTELTYGAGSGNVINSTKTTECVNIGDDLNSGSAFANILEVTLRTPDGNLSLTAGDEVTLYKVDDGGSRSQVGVYTLEKPTRPKANTMKLTGYDHVAKLDKDLTEWLKALDGWPYTVAAFAGMVCQECGLTFVESEVPNSNFPIQQFSKIGVTGRQIMRWLGEICCRFVRATAAGDIEFGWYTHAQKAITPSGDPYIFAGGLSYETYQVAPVDAVQLRLADSTEGALWPAVEEGANSYIISGNAILLSRVTDDLLPYLDVIKTELSAMTYTPCKVSIPANLDIKAGSIVDITDKNGKTVTTYVMTKTTSGQRDTLESTGSPRRDSSSAINNKSSAEKAAEAESYANSAAQQAVDNQTQEEIFNKLTNNGADQGIYIKDGKIYINASYILTGEMLANLITAGILKSKETEDGLISEFDLDNGIFKTRQSYAQRYITTVIRGSLISMIEYNAATNVTTQLLTIEARTDGGDPGVTISDGVSETSQGRGLHFYGAGYTWIGTEDSITTISGSEVHLGQVVRVSHGNRGARLLSDFVEEIGTSGIWTYRKWADGVYECWGAVEVSDLACTTAWGSVYETAEISIPDWPYRFVSAPTVTLSWAGYWGAIPEGIKDLTETSGGRTLLMRATSKAALNGRIMIHAAGRWY